MVANYVKVFRKHFKIKLKIIFFCLANDFGPSEKNTTFTVIPLLTHRSTSPVKDAKPVQRSSSLRSERNHRKDRNSERRRTCLPLISPSPSKDDLKKGFNFDRYVKHILIK